MPELLPLHCGLTSTPALLQEQNPITMQVQQVEASSKPEMTNLIEEIKGRIKYYHELNMHAGNLSHRIRDTTRPEPECAKKETQVRPQGLISDLEDINDFLAIQNSIFQDTVNKLAALL